MVNFRAPYDLFCPIIAGEKCRQAPVDGKQGELHYWTQKEYQSFFTAFLRNKLLVEAFIDEQKLTEFNSDPKTFLSMVEEQRRIEEEEKRWKEEERWKDFEFDSDY